MTFLAEWGSEIILSLVIAILTYYFKKADKAGRKRRIMVYYSWQKYEIKKENK